MAKSSFLRRLLAQALALHHPAGVKRLILANTLHSAGMWQRNHENINAEIERQYPEVWDRIVAHRARGLRAPGTILFNSSVERTSG